MTDAPDMPECFAMDHRHRVVFEHDALTAGTALIEMLRVGDAPARTLFVVDDGLVASRPDMLSTLDTFARTHADIITPAGHPLLLPGGEACKQGTDPGMTPVVDAIRSRGICRRSTVLVLGGGAVLDAAGFGAAVAHRGVRLVRMPTTTLAQGDAGVGVKNGVNMPGVRGGKNLLGTFDVPVGVLNDPTLLTSLDDVHWRAGLAESIKVGLVKDAALLDAIEQDAAALTNRDLPTMTRVIERTAELHVAHIVDGGDPFERERARPLDFGHWMAHELEATSDWAVPHGEAVAMGMCVDLLIGEAMGITESGLAERMQHLLRELGFLQWPVRDVGPDTLLDGLEHFRQHLGGELTVCMIQSPQHAVDVHAIDAGAARSAVSTVLDVNASGV